MRVTLRRSRLPRFDLHLPRPRLELRLPMLDLPALRRPRIPRPRWSWACAAIGIYLALRALCLLYAWYWAAARGHDLWTMLGTYDAVWYSDIARHGYDSAIALRADHRIAPTNLAFFPLFPALIVLTDPLVPGGADSAGIVVAWVSSAVAAAGLYAVGNHVRGRGAGLLLAALWAVLPQSLVQSMGYAESLFTALAAWSLFALLRRRWLAAGLLCAVAGLTRPTAAALVLVVCLAALIAVIRRRDGRRPWVAGAVAPLGLLGYMAWVGDRLGRVDGYFYAQSETWGQSMDLGRYTVGTAQQLLTEPSPAALYLVTLILVMALGLMAVLIGDRVPWPLWVYSLGVLATAFLSDNYYNAKARMLLPAFPLLLPVAVALARSRRLVVIAVLTLLTLISAGYGVYLSQVWSYSP